MHEIRRSDALALASWYENNKRALPWRDTGDPYDVWLSEIMLQQTRIEAVREKFILFKKELPTIETLASCPEDRLMRLWEGLGYYNRARNLQKCAKVLMEQYDGHLPENYETLLSLPGIGSYTAGAIASIAFHIAVAAVDGNVLRVLARYTKDTRDVRNPQVKKETEELIQNLFHDEEVREQANLFNQGLMELGETICLPKGNIQCDNCPWHSSCAAHRENLTDSIPYRSALKQRKIIQRTLLIIRDGHRFILHKRPATGLLAGLYEFIGIDTDLSIDKAIQETEKLGFHALHVKELPASRHIFTHLEWHMKAYEIQCEEIETLPGTDYIAKEKKELAHTAVPSAFKTYLDWYNLRD